MKLLFTLLFICCNFVLLVQTQIHAFEINHKLGRGMNYGNMFEAPTESGWGNRWQPENAEIKVNYKIYPNRTTHNLTFDNRDNFEKHIN